MAQNDEFKKLATEIATYDIDRLCRADQPKQVSFSEFRPDFERVRKFFQLIAGVRLDLVPFPESTFLHQLDNVKRIKSILDRITTIDLLAEQNPQGTRTSMISNLHQSTREIFGQINLVLFYSLFAEQRLSELEAELRTQLDQKIAEVETTKAHLMQDVKSEAEKINTYGNQVISELKGKTDSAQSILKQVEEIAQSARKAAQITGIGAQSEHFKALADENSESAKLSLRWAFGIGAFLLLFGVLSYFFEKPAAGNPELVQKLVARVLFISVGFTAFIVCFRNYGAAKHNYTVNRHKATTLKTFEVFINGSSNQEVKEAILLQAAKSAFEPQSTGFLRTEGDGPQISQITELVKASK